jgi:large subunit ribosomal protein L27
VRIGRDDTLYAVAEGIVAFERYGKNRQRVSVHPATPPVS